MTLWTDLVSIVFPAIGDFIGRLTAIAQLSYNEFTDFMFRGEALFYTNPFLGSQFSHSLPGAVSTILYVPLGLALAPAAALLNAMGLQDSPMWIALLLSAATWGLLIGALSSLTKLVTGAFR